MILLTYLIFFIISILIFMYYLFTKNDLMMNMNFASMYECGFMNMTFSRFFFSMNMFIYMILFIILDMEIFILMLMVFYENNFLIILNIFIISMIILMFYEWFSMSLNWFIK
uniref:NADH-ubiquinone oxidoreductase chain 3 n=1 Tax=Tetranychus ludeni TaxID=182134 RepID=A0A075X8Z0_TETLU|nr:NADH dehydrogenase subunit 3 [Tetranychus ludeni]AIH15653.1 NADH dehydrogenase subunit 3 [Tetranychus ludeni]